MQGKKSSRRIRCASCHNLFQPDLRTQGKQRYCSKKECQRIRQRQNEYSWRKRNLGCLKYQYELSRKWNKLHPDYSRKRRLNNQGLLKYNRMQTRLRMQKIRKIRLFDKSKVILRQLTGNKADKCYLTRGYKWLYVRLTKASPLSRLRELRDNRPRYILRDKHMPEARLYELSNIFNEPSKGP